MSPHDDPDYLRTLADDRAVDEEREREAVCGACRGTQIAIGDPEQRDQPAPCPECVLQIIADLVAVAERVDAHWEGTDAPSAVDARAALQKARML